MAAIFRATFVVLAVILATVGVPGSPTAGQAIQPEFPDARQVTATATEQTYEDGPSGTVFTMTRLEAADGETVTVRTDGGLHSSGIVQHTSHEAQFTVGRRYRIELLASALDGAAADEPIYSVVGGPRGVIEVDRSGAAVDRSNSDPSNFILQPYNWNWTLPDNPPVMLVNPNAATLGNEASLMQAAMNIWEDDPNSAMDFSYGGTTSIDTIANDGTNTIFWGDTPDPADTFLAQSITWYDPSTGRAVASDIMFNNDYSWADGAVAGAFDVLSVGIHELGHTIGLGHAPNQPAIMFFSISDNVTNRSLSQGDRGGVAALYPAPSAGEAVTGQVTFSDGAAATDVGVDLFTENRGQWLAAGSTDRDGNYRFDLQNGAGCYVVTFIAPQGSRFAANGEGFQNQAFCATAGQTVAGVNAILTTPGAATSSGGRVTFADGSAAGNISIDLFTENRARWLSAGTTDANGDYTFNLFPGAGCYVTTFIAPPDTQFTASGTGFQNVAFCAAEGQSVTGIDAVLTTPDSQATIGGDITNPDGSPQAGVEAAQYTALADGSRGQWLGSTFSDASGRWQADRPTGCYIVDLVAPDGRTWSASGNAYLQLASCVSQGEIDLTLGGTLN